MTCLPDTVIYYFLFVLGYSVLLNVVLWWIASKFEDKYKKANKSVATARRDARYYRTAYIGLYRALEDKEPAPIMKRLFCK